MKYIVVIFRDIYLIRDLKKEIFSNEPHEIFVKY